ncbi:MAG: LamG domain-containing protein [Gammaproteobacteria bacterium]|nr:LamG domain-containing protein [Gammaproteobacteria bacterium]
MKKSLFIGIALLFFSTPLLAATIITAATVDGGSSTTVTGGATISVEMFVTTTGGGNANDWESSQWRFGAAGATTCVDHSDFLNAGNHNLSFNITAPITDGTYDLYLVAYRNDTCTGGNSGDFILNNAVIVSSGGSCDAFTDDFSSNSFTGGSANWATNWIEVDGAGAGAGSGNAQISGGILNLDDNPNTGGQPSLARQADLSAYDTATLSFDFSTTAGVDNSDAVILEISNNGGGSYNPIETFTNINGVFNDTRSIDITGDISANTRFRFRVTNLYGGGNEQFQVDNLQILACSTFTAPTVNTLSTDDTTPVLDGTFDSAGSTGGFTVSVDGTTYTLGSSPELTNVGDDWTLDLSAATPLAVGVYEVVASADDGAGTVLTDATSNELTITAPVCTVTFRDEFSNVSFANNDGDVNFTAAWDEYEGTSLTVPEASPDPTIGHVSISGGQLVLNNFSPESPNSPGVVRELDLSGYTSATFSFDFVTSGGVDADDSLLISASADGGANWTQLDDITGIGDTSGSRSYDLTPYISANTQISLRFNTAINTGNCCYGGVGETISIDNINIDATGACPVVPPYAWFKLDASAGTWDGTAGEVVDDTGNIGGAFALGTGSGVDAVPARICNGVDVPSNTTDAAQYGIDTSIDVDDDIGGQGSINFWYRSNNAWIGGGDRTLFDASPDDLTPADHYFLLALRNDGSLVFGLEDSADGDFRIFTGANNIAANTWAHIAVTWDINGERRVYLNGTLIGTESGATNGNMGEFRTLYFGDNRSTYHPDGSPNSANGQIDEIRVYDVVQTAAQIDSDLNATHPCPATPVAEYRLDEASWNGTAGEVTDSSGNGLDGTSFAGAVPVPAQVCNGALLNGAGYVEVADNALLDIADELTVTAWVNTNAIPASGLKTILSKDENYEFHINSSGQINWWWGGGAQELTSTGTLTAGDWYHIAIVYSDAADFQAIYINGVESGTNNQTGTLTLNNDPLQIGADQGFAGREFDGLIDEVRIYNAALTPAEVNTVLNETRPCAATISYYGISHGGVGVTCEAEAVTITALDASDNPVSPSSSTTITLTTSQAIDGWALRNGDGTFIPPNQYTFDGIETAVEFWLTKTSATTAPHIDIDVSDGAITDLDDGGAQDPALEFRDTALRFYADGVYNDLGTRIAGKSSAGEQVLTLRAVQTNTDTGACEARVAGAQTVQMAYECMAPNTCSNLTNDGVTIIDSVIGGAGDTVTDNDAGASPLTYDDVGLTFDVNGIATWTMNYVDAGQIRLYASLDIPAAGEDPADNLSGTSNIFTSVPAGLCVYTGDANADCASGDASCTAFTQAGQNFNLSVKAVAWETSGESNSAFCNNATTPNFQLSIIGISHTRVAPVPGVDGSIDVSSFNTIASDDGDHTITNQQVSEVGVFTFTASPPAYFGETIADSTSANIGRFYPAEFRLTNTSLTNRSALGCVIPSPFTYMDENFQLGYRLTAYSGGGVAANVTQNYTSTSGFAKLDTAAELGYGTVETVGLAELTTRLNPGSPTITFNNGVANINDTLSLGREPTGLLDGAFNLSVGIAPSDDDGVLLDSYDLDVNNDATDDHGQVANTDIYYGRMALENTFGSELVSLDMPMQAEYYDSASSSFLPNAADDCTSFTSADLTLSSAVEAGQVDGDIIVLTVGASNKTSSISLLDPLVSGEADLRFCPPGDPACTPGSGNEGYIDVELDLSAYPYLQFDWNGDSVIDANDYPTARATFGIYRGNPAQIYYRQIYQ